MRLKAIIYFIIFFSWMWSCNQKDKNTELLSLKYDEKGFLDVYTTADNKLILKNLYASFTDRDENQIYPGENIKMNQISFTDEMGKGREYLLETVDTDAGLQTKWILRTFEDKSVLAGRLEITNHSENPFRVNRLSPFSCRDESGGILMNYSGPMQYLEIEPETWATKSMKKLDQSGTGKFVTGIATPEGKGVVIGCVSFNRFRGIFEFEDLRKSSGLLRFNAHNPVDDHLVLKPGQTLSSEWFYIDCTEDILASLEQWACIAGSMNQAVISDPPAAGFYTWYYYRDYVSEKIMLDNACFLAENRDRFPVNFIHIDWGWQRKYSSGDTVPNGKFPHGLGWLARQIRNAGFSPSIWVNPFMYTNPTAEAPVLHPDLFLKNEEGDLVKHEPIRNIMARAWGDAPYMILDGTINVLDVSNPDTYEFLKKRYKWVGSLGFDMAMMDFIIYGRNHYGNGDRLKFPEISTFEGIRKALLSAREGLGKHRNVLGCGTIYEVSVGTSNLTRISYDATANWPSAKVASTDLILQYFMNNALWTNYADGIFVRAQESPYWGEYELDDEGNRIPMFLTDDEARFYTAVTGLSQSAVMYTEDIKQLKPDRQWLLTMILPIYQDGKFRPVDLFKTIPAKTLQLVCNENGRNWTIAAGLNWTDEIDEKGLDVSLLNLPHDTRYHAYDVFRKEYIGIISADTLLGPIPLHGVLLVNLVPVLDRPQVVGSDLHISQGGIEISHESWDDQARSLKLGLNNLYGREGHLYIHVPEEYTIGSNLTYSVEPVKDGSLVRVPVKLDSVKTLEIRFEN